MGICCDNLMQLTMAAIKAKLAANQRHTIAPFCCVTKLNNSATSVEPRVWPSSRAVPIMPLAPPLLLTGAEAMIVLLFGVWNKPNPMPQMSIRHIISLSVGEEDRWESKYKPRAKINMPAQPSIPACIRSTR